MLSDARGHAREVRARPSLLKSLRHEFPTYVSSCYPSFGVGAGDGVGADAGDGDGQYAEIGTT